MKSKFTLLLLCALGLGLCSCQEKLDKTTSKTVFTNGIPKSINGIEIIRDKDGRVEKYVFGDSFVASINYSPEESVKKQYDCDVVVSESEYIVYIKLNDLGYASSSIEIAADRTGEDVVTYTYNGDGQLCGMKGMKEVDKEDDYTMSYDFVYEDGDIVKEVVTECEELLGAIIYKYGQDVVDNKYNVMLWSPVFESYFSGININTAEDRDVHFTLSDILYYAGMLGKSTKHLPISESIEGEDGSRSLEWKCLPNGQPTSLYLYDWNQSDGQENRDIITFEW